jgi:DNA repair exonuclease SbcCD ATPase subunit
MTAAILEILVLLIVSCAIGIFFTYRYWKAKYNQKNDELTTSQSENNQLKEKINQLGDEIQSLQKEMETIRSDKANHEKKSPSKKPGNDQIKKLKAELKELKSSIEIKDQSLNEKEREIEALSKELSAKKISYYKQIDGKRYKSITLIKADEAVAGKGDGRISKADAEIIFATISDGKSYTQVEKDTMRYLRDNYNWTDEADALFRSKVRSWAAKGHELDN